MIDKATERCATRRRPSASTPDGGFHSSPSPLRIRRSYRFRIYPDATQREFFERTVGCCRLLYNLCLDQKKLELERSDPRKLFAFDQINEIPKLKREFPFFKEVPANSLQQTVLDLHQGFANFFAGRARFPRFRMKGRHNSFRHPDPKHVKIETDRIFMPKSGWTKMVMHRPILGEVRNITVSETAGRWFVSIQVEREIPAVASHEGSAIGIDLAGPRPILSDGRIVDLPTVGSDERRRLASAQRTMARRHPGSQNRAKARLRLARLEASLARRRQDALHKATTTIVKNHGIVAIGDSGSRTIPAGPLAVSSRDATSSAETVGRLQPSEFSPGMFRDMLMYKAAGFGSKIIAVDLAASPPSHEDTSPTACAILAMAIASTGGLPGMACESSRPIGRKQDSMSARAAAGSKRSR
jgi:putative transposase